MRSKLVTVCLLAWYFYMQGQVIGPFDTRGRCQKIARVAECYCVLMFPMDCNDLVN